MQRARTSRGEDAREHAGHEQTESRRRGEASPGDDVRGGLGGCL